MSAAAEGQVPWTFDALDASAADKAALMEVVGSAGDSLLDSLEFDRALLVSGRRPLKGDVVILSEFPDRWRLRFTLSHVDQIEEAIRSVMRRVLDEGTFPASLAEALMLHLMLERAHNWLVDEVEGGRRLARHIDDLFDYCFEDADHTEASFWRARGFKKLFVPYGE